MSLHWHGCLRFTNTFHCDLIEAYKLSLQGTVRKLTDQLEKMQQKMSESEAAWRKKITEKEATIVQLTAEKENLKREVEQLKTQVNRPNYIKCMYVLLFDCNLSTS